MVQSYPGGKSLQNIDSIRALHNLVQARFTEMKNDLPDKSRELLAELFTEAIEILANHETAINDLQYRVDHPMQGPTGTKYPKA